MYSKSANFAFSPKMLSKPTTQQHHFSFLLTPTQNKLGAMPLQILTANDVMQEGLIYMNFSPAKQASCSFDNNSTEFKKHYGLLPHIVAEIWRNLCTTKIALLKLCNKEKGQTGLKYLLMVIHFMFVYPQNRHNLVSWFVICDKLASGISLWKWASCLVGLKKKVIRVPEEFSDPNGWPIIMTLDCRDHNCQEKKHPRFNLDISYGSKKLGFHAALKYELGVVNFYNQIV